MPTESQILAIGIMIGSYIVVRMVSFVSRKGERRESVIATVLAYIAIPVTLFCMFGDLLMTRFRPYARADSPLGTVEARHLDKPDVNAERFAQVMESRFQRFENEVATAQTEFPGVPAEQWQKMSNDIASGRRLLAEMAGLTEQNDLQAKVSEVNKVYISARKALTEVTGK